MAARSAKSVLFEEFNDIDIYIEDTAIGYEKLFTEVFSRVFNDKYKISNVYPLGCRDTVVNECTELQGKFNRPCLYVVDGDLHLILGKNAEELEGLYVLPFYCIENLLLDESAIVELLNEEEPVKMKEELSSEFDFNGWLSVNRDSLLMLFVEYAICFSLYPEIQTVGFPITKLVSSNKGIVDEEKVNLRIQELRTILISKFGEEKHTKEHQELIHSLRLDENQEIIKYVSGKDYLMPLLMARFKSIVKTRLPNINFKLRLAIKCDVSILDGCKLCVRG